jgi:hypothetical protein
MDVVRMWYGCGMDVVWIGMGVGTRPMYLTVVWMSVLDPCIVRIYYLRRKYMTTYNTCLLVVPYDKYDVP